VGQAYRRAERSLVSFHSVQGSKTPAFFGIRSQIARWAAVHALIGIELGKKIIAFSLHGSHAFIGRVSEIDYNLTSSVNSVFGTFDRGLALG
jgi:hypothetical protein